MGPAHYARTISEIAARREPFAVASVVRTHGSTLGKPGFKAVVSEDGRIVYGSLGGVCPDGPIIQVALETMKAGSPRLVTVHLVDATKAVSGTVRTANPDEIWVETNCGGSMEIYVEPYLPPHRLVIIAQGGRDEIEDHLVHLAKRLGYEVAVIDHLPALTEQPDELIDDPGFDLGKFPFVPSDAVVVLTKGERDVSVLEMLSRKAVAYVGMLASRQRTKENFETLRAHGTSEQFLKGIHTPIGIDLGGRAPIEIALAIMAEIVAARHGRRFSLEA
jgi:xanthine dehydrogenase accessory factor